MIRIACLSAALALAALGLIANASAQSKSPQPYAGLASRTVKAMAEEQIADLLAGRGMGLALAAELNGYPGPLHTLENAEALGLAPEQRERTETLFHAMKTEVVPIGARLIAHETELDGLFATRTVTPENLTAVTAEIGGAQGELRAAHLRYHLAMMDVLTPEQIRLYAEIRGYSGAGGSTGHGSHGGHAH